jgi:DNA-binding GntR family transcriptional regulator
MKRVERKPLSEQVYKKLLMKIMEGSIPVGGKLREERLCESLGVIRTPLREALLRLAREGVLERLPNRGCAVRKRSLAEIAELMECRALMEGLALRRWSAFFDKAELRCLKERLDAAPQLPETIARKEVLEADEALHALILSSCANAVFRERLEGLQQLCRPYRVYRCEDSGDLAGIARERLAIVEPLLSGDRDAALLALEAHFAKSAVAFSAQAPAPSA